MVRCALLRYGRGHGVMACRYASFGGNVGPGDDAFDIDGLRELQREALRVTAGLTQLTDPSFRIDGWDGSRSVRVAMDGSGRVADVEVGRSWRDVLRPAELGVAVVEAVNAAETERMDAWARAAQQPAHHATNGGDGSGAWLADLDVGAANGFRSLSDPAAQESTRELFYLAMDAIDRLGEASRSTEETSTGAVRGQSPDRLVTVTTDRGRVVSVDFDHSWLRQAPAMEINQRLRTAFDAVDQASPRSIAAKALDNSTIRELQQVSADPRELLRRLGFG